jgi:hypothetical protein
MVVVGYQLKLLLHFSVAIFSLKVRVDGIEVEVCVPLRSYSYALRAGQYVAAALSLSRSLQVTGTGFCNTGRSLVLGCTPCTSKKRVLARPFL